MVSTPTLAEATRLLATLLVDRVQLHDVGEPVTTGFTVTRQLTNVGLPLAALVQQTTLENAVESRTTSLYSIKVAQGTELHAGQAITVVECGREPALVGKVLLLDKVSLNGLALIRKAVASDYAAVNQQGKAGL